MNKLKVGDVIYWDKYNKIAGKMVIDRVTKTMAFSERIAFHIDYIGERVFLVDREIGSNNRHYIENEERKKEFIKEMALYKIKNFTNYDDLSIEALNKILEIINAYAKEVPQVPVQEK